ncbi:MAG: hypothetical protein U9N07_04410 [Euryarchaeota archaeon]|nr:hypothetical protein [Euryarchaeota archaeon]
MKRDVSFSLLGLILLLSIGIAACSVYYQYTYADLQSKYDVSNETLHKTMSDYQEKERILDAVLQNLTLAEEREEVLGEKYVTVETEKEELQSELTQTQNALGSLQKKHDRLEMDYDSLNRKYRKLSDENLILKMKINDLEDDIKRLKKRIAELEGQPAE